MLPRGNLMAETASVIGAANRRKSWKRPCDMNDGIKKIAMIGTISGIQQRVLGNQCLMCPVNEKHVTNMRGQSLESAVEAR